jgi:hypothetical protein
MAEPNLDRWVQSHMRWLALSRWENEGGASPARPTAHAHLAAVRHGLAEISTTPPRPASQTDKATPSRQTPCVR